MPFNQQITDYRATQAFYTERGVGGLAPHLAHTLTLDLSLNIESFCVSLVFHR